MNSVKLKFTKRIFFLFSVISMMMFSSFTSYAPKYNYKIKTIVIDPGHGGHDSGCLGSSAKEKQVALAVALKLGKLIEEKYPDINVIYTRTTDVFVELHERAAIANRNHADLFLCIHCNSGPPSAFGTETFVMGLHKSNDNLAVAKRENSSILLEDDYKKNYDGFDPNSPEANIIFSLYQNSFLTQSLKLASLIQQQFEEFGGRFNRGVKQAGFLVLYRTTMPSILIETGFLTNATEERYLHSEKGQQTIATSIYRAFAEYKLDLETVPEENKTEVKQGTNNDLPKSNPVAVKEEPKQKEAVKTPELKIETENDSTKPPLKPTTDTGAVAKPVKEKTEPPVVKKDVEVKKDVAPKPIAALPQVYFTIQVGALPEAGETEMERFKLLGNVNKVKLSDGLTRINFGIYKSAPEAQQKLSIAKSKGFKDAYVVAYDGNKKITIQEAQKLLK
jgi:N-acetylmuramoyl-L-alanine amidase